MNIIAIDCGASFIKFALFKNNELVKKMYMDSPGGICDKNILCTEKIEELIALVVSGIKTLSCEIENAVVCIDNEMHGFILAHPDGRPYTGYISWQTELANCKEVLAHVVKHVGTEKAESLINCTGMPLRSGLPSSNLFWLKQNGYLNKHERLFFYTLGDYIIRRIARIEPVCHITNAAATGLVDLKNEKWNEELISILVEKTPIVFPKIGKEAIRINADKPYCILPAIGDQQAALLGSGINDSQQLSFNIGTGAQVSRLISEFSQYNNSDGYQIRPYFYDTYIKTIPHIPSGRAVNVFFRFLKGILKKYDSTISDETIWSIMGKAISKKTNTDSLCCDLSFFENAITNNTRGCISNISEYGFTLENLLSSVFSQLVDNFVLIANKVNNGLPAYDTIVFSGGMAKRWDILRTGIAENLKSDARIILSKNDALYGCMVYAIISQQPTTKVTSVR